VSNTWLRGEVYAAGRHLATYSGGTTYFNFADHLGTERVRATVGGTVAESCTSLPFGDWLTCTGSDSSPMHFTGQERDGETGNDNFGFRYYGSSIGRFLSPDDPFVDQHTGDPQSWNLYSYVRNNPLRFTDPDGHDCTQDENGNFFGDCASPGDELVTQSNLSQQFTVFEPPSDALNPLAMAIFTDPIFQNTIGTFDNVIGPAFLIEMSFLPGVLQGSMAPVGAGLSLQAMRPPTVEGPAGQVSRIIDADQVIFRPQQLEHAVRVEAGHSTPIANAQEIQVAVKEAIISGPPTNHRPRLLFEPLVRRRFPTRACMAKGTLPT
jgi:RHS repeat-associated protein